MVEGAQIGKDAAMKELLKTKLEFITPAFLAGANQDKPEVRVPSIRGEVRWWFRVLGGTQEEESEVFGAVHGGAKASAVVLRVSEVNEKWGPEITFPPMSDKGYVYYFAKVSGNKEGIHRTAASHYYASGTSFILSAVLRSAVTPTSEARLRLALRAFLTFGSLGLRATRGCGALATAGDLSMDELRQLTDEMGKALLIRRIEDNVYTSGEKCQEALGGFLRAFRKDNQLSGKKRTALGFSSGKSRASSAMRLRPVRVKNGFLPVVIYTDSACNQPSVSEIVRVNTLEI